MSAEVEDLCNKSFTVPPHEMHVSSMMGTQGAGMGGCEVKCCVLGSYRKCGSIKVTKESVTGSKNSVHESSEK